MPFELGRPLGIPGDAAFQKRVLRACLTLLENDSGPVIEDFTEEAPLVGGDDGSASCPINFARPQQQLEGSEAIAASLHEEVSRLTPWYDRHVNAEGRTSFGSSTLSIEDIVVAVSSMFDGHTPAGPVPGISLAEGLRLAVEDLKAFYTEAMMAQPGTSPNDALIHWFWNNTAAGRILLDMKEICLQSGDEELQLFSNVFLVPRSQVDSMTS